MGSITVEKDTSEKHAYSPTTGTIFQEPDLLLLPTQETDMQSLGERRCAHYFSRNWNSYWAEFSKTCFAAEDDNDNNPDI